MSRINLWRLNRVAQPLPTLKCPANTVGQATSTSGAHVTYAAATATDILTTASLSYTAASGDSFPMGAKTVTATAKDAYGGAASCTFTVTVKDTAVPKLTCPANLALDTLDPRGAVAAYSAQAGDPVSTPTVSYEPSVGSILPLGKSTVQVTATDAAGNASTCSFEVQVTFTGPLSVTCPSDIVAAASSADGASVEYAPAVVVDPAGSAEAVYSRESGNVFPVGTTSVTAVANQAGSMASCSFQVTVLPFAAGSNPDGGSSNETPARSGGCSAAAAELGWAVSALAFFLRRRSPACLSNEGASGCDPANANQALACTSKVFKATACKNCSVTSTMVLCQQ